MSWFAWLQRSSGPAPGGESVPASRPVDSGGSTESQPLPQPQTQTEEARQARLVRREQLQAVIRDSMVRAGVLSASYQFKVLAVDPMGREYVAMFDLARAYSSDMGRLAEIEAMIAQSARALHDIRVRSVYWRINDHVAVGLAAPHGPRRAPVADRAARLAELDRSFRDSGRQAPPGATDFEDTAIEPPPGMRDWSQADDEMPSRSQSLNDTQSGDTR